tara:strand:- start:4539 stop:5396 length:858 start_codon:yes stop_codon:yes gene_type:complete
MGFLEDLGNFVNSITSGQGQNYVSDRERRANEATGQGNVQTGSGGPKRSEVVRPKLRPKTITVPSGGDDGGTRTIPFADYKPTPTNVPYFGGPNISPPTPAKERGFQNFKETFKNIPSSIATDLRLGIGSLSGPEGFTDALESLGFGTFRNKDGGISDEAALAYANFQQASRDSRDRQEEESMGDGDDDFYGNYDPCPEGYRTDPVTGMCVPVMGVAYDTAPSAPAQYQGNFVGDPFPTIASGGGMTSPVVPSMDYTQPMDFTSPTITPPTPQGIAGIPLTPIMV